MLLEVTSRILSCVLKGVLRVSEQSKLLVAFMNFALSVYNKKEME